MKCFCPTRQVKLEKMLGFWIVVLFFLGGWSDVQAQVNFYAKASKTEMNLDERVRVDFVLNTKEDNFTPPDFKDFIVLMGPSVSTSYSWINGQSSFSKTYSYFLQPRRTGKLIIGRAKAVVNGEEYYTEPIEIEVKEAPSAPPAAAQRGDPKNIRTNGKDIFLDIIIRKSTAYVGEGVGVTYMLYIKRGTRVSDFNISDMPSFKGFWSEVLSSNVSQAGEVEIDGVPYTAYKVYEVLLFPQKPGDFRIKPLKADIVQIKREERYGGFFSYMEDVPVRLHLSSKSKMLRVLALPDNGKPENFSGAVGNFNFEVILNKDTVQAGTDVELRMKLSGTGNFEMLDLPEIHLSNGIEIFEPEIKRNYKAGLNGYSGSMEKVYALIPQRPGKYIIPSVSFSFFNPETKKYVKIQSKEKILYVQTSTSVTYSGGQPANNGQILKPLSYQTSWNKIAVRQGWLKKPWVRLLYLLAFILALVAWLWKKFREHRAANPAILKKQKMRKEIEQYLKKAKENISDAEQYYGALERALYTFFKYELELSPVELTKENILKILERKKIDSGLINKLKSLWETIETSRYMPVSASNKEQDWQEAKDMLNRLEKELKK